MGVSGNWSDWLSKGEAEQFVGREQELEVFRQEIASLTPPPAVRARQPGLARFARFLRLRRPASPAEIPPQPLSTAPHYLIFYISGQGGVGKTTLLNRYRELARAAHFCLAESDERQKDIPSVLGQFAHQFADQGALLKHFSERYRTYQQKMQEIENDPKAPQGWSSLVGRTIVRTAFAGVDLLPGVRQVATLLPQDALEEQASEWSAYLLEKALSKDDIALLRDPVSILTELFFKDLNACAEKTPILLIFENFEVTRPELQEWLLRLPEYRPSTRIRVAIASRSDLGASWDSLRGVTLSIRLDAFSPREAEQFLNIHGILDATRRREILEYSGRLPVIMSWLAAPGNQNVGPLQPAQNIVEHFLQWVAEPTLREVALRAALPRTLNLDILAVLLQNRDAVLIESRQAFTWLRTMPFVKARSDGWQYHEVVRRMMLRYQRTISPQTYCELHATLAGFYQARREELGLSGTEMWANEEWRKATLLYCYHLLVANPTRNWSAVLSIFSLALRRRRTFAREIIDLLCLEDVQAEFTEEQSSRLRFLRGELRKLMRGANQEGFALFDYLCRLKDLAPEARGHVLAYRGECYRLEEKWDQALDDLNNALQLIPDDAHTLTRRSVIYISTERYEAALEDLEHSLSIEKNGIWAIAMRGETSRRLKRYAEALDDFSHAIELDEKNAWFRAMRGETYRQMGQYEQALFDFDSALVLKSEGWIVERRNYTLWQKQQAQKTTGPTRVSPDQPIPIPSWLVPGHQSPVQPPIPYPSSAAMNDLAYQYFYPPAEISSGSTVPYPPPPIPAMPPGSINVFPPLPSQMEPVQKRRAPSALLFLGLLGLVVVLIVAFLIIRAHSH